jgi:hypothetical protein
MQKQSHIPFVDPMTRKINSFEEQETSSSTSVVEPQTAWLLPIQAVIEQIEKEGDRQKKEALIVEALRLLADASDALVKKAKDYGWFDNPTLSLAVLNHTL